MKYLKNLKFFTENKKNIYNVENITIKNIYESITFSDVDQNIDNLINQINNLKDKNIEYYVIKYNFETIIYFKIFCFPKSIYENNYLYKNYNFNDSTNLYRKSYDDIKKQCKNISLKGDITKEYIDILYQADKYNL